MTIPNNPSLPQFLLIPGGKLKMPNVRHSCAWEGYLGAEGAEKQPVSLAGKQLVFQRRWALLSAKTQGNWKYIGPTSLDQTQQAGKCWVSSPMSTTSPSIEADHQQAVSFPSLSGTPPTYACGQGAFPLHVT